MSAFDRRTFLHGFLVTVAANTSLVACGDDETDPQGDGYSRDAEDQKRVFPQGLASGDPKPDSIILWTRVEVEGATSEVTFEVSTTEDFAEVIATEKIETQLDFDHTLRIKVTKLEAFTTYFYRFKAEGEKVASIVGRTKTAPKDDQDTPVRFAMASCQDFVGRYYHSWKALNDEVADAPVDFVLFLGDYVYETNGDPDFQMTAPDRAVVLPDGLEIEEDDPTVKAALTLADYRALYKQYRSDEHLQLAHARYPFICIWDDHEFANDCWQDHATDFNDLKGDEKSTDRRMAASRAWFEFQPADVVYDEAKAFPDDIKIYRSMRYGKHVELFLTDQRSYRSDHVIPEGGAPGDKPAGAPETVPAYVEVGKIFVNSEVFSRNFVKKPAFDLIEAYVKPTMLGATQKAWFIDAVTSSTATWKLWGNETQLAQMLLDLTPFDIPENFKGLYYFTCDQWDGYRTERKEVLTALDGTTNLVALTGDIHAFYACEIHVDPDVTTGEPMMVEYVTAGVSSSPVQEIAGTVVAGNEAFATLADLVPMFDTVLLGASAEYKYARSLTHGTTLVEVSAGEFGVTFLQVADVKKKTFDGKIDRVKYVTKAGTNRVEKV